MALANPALRQTAKLRNKLRKWEGGDEMNIDGAGMMPVSAASKSKPSRKKVEILLPEEVFCPDCRRKTSCTELTILAPRKFLCNEGEHRAFTKEESEKAQTSA